LPPLQEEEREKKQGKERVLSAHWQRRRGQERERSREPSAPWDDPAP